MTSVATQLSVCFSYSLLPVCRSFI